MLIALLISLLFGPYGPEAMFTIPDMEERLTTNIPDEARRAEVMAIFTKATKDLKAFEKRIELQGNDLKKDQSDRELSSSELRIAFEELFLTRQELQFIMVDRDTEVRELLTDEEFRTIITDGLIATVPTEEQAAEQALKKRQEMAQVLADIRKGIQDAVSDPTRQVRALAAFDVFEAHMDRLIKEEPRTHGPSRIYEQREITRLTLEETYEDMDGYRAEMFDRFIEMREVLIATTERTEWPMIASKLNVMFK